MYTPKLLVMFEGHQLEDKIHCFGNMVLPCAFWLLLLMELTVLLQVLVRPKDSERVGPWDPLRASAAA